MHKKKKTYLSMLVGCCTLALTGCYGQNNPDPIVYASVTGEVTQNLPLTAAANLPIQFKATITNMGGSAMGSITIADVTYPTTNGVDSNIDSTGGVGAGANCYDPNTGEGAALAENQSCNIVINYTNQPGMIRDINGDIIVALTNAKQSAISYPVSSTFISQTNPINQTGQTKCYDSANPANEIPCAGTGQAGEFRAGVAWNIANRFIDNGNTTVTDSLTGLMWQQDPSVNNGNTTVTWQTALNNCNNLNQGGHKDWRLPNRNELISLGVLNGNDSPAAELNAHGFDNVLDSSDVYHSYYWTASVVEREAENSAYTGKFHSNHWYIFSYSENEYTWCVRGDTTNSNSPTLQTGQNETNPFSAPEGSDGTIQAGLQWDINTRFVDNGNTTVTDTLTGLMWQQDPSVNGNGQWDEALSTCNTLNQGGYADWRLPNRNELLSINILNSSNSAVLLSEYEFSNVDQVNGYWASTTDPTNTPYASIVEFGLSPANNGWMLKTDERESSIWCVRGGI